MSTSKLKLAKTLVNRANVIFPLIDYAPASATRHARRKWVEKMFYMLGRDDFDVPYRNRYLSLQK